MIRRLAAFAAVFVLLQCAWIVAARAGTTGSIVGRVTDSSTQAGIANATVTIVSPSQSASTTTDPSGAFRFLSLAPDTYVLSVERSGYDPVSVSGVTVVADQSQSLPVGLSKALRQIGHIQARSVADLIKPGTTSDVYSVNPAGAEAAHALGGPGGLDNAYSAIASVPGVNVQQGQQGWFQTVSIRGGDIDQVGYELDGIPVNRVYDNAPQTMLSNIGQQELQVYTGGTPATADASGIAGYVNQVIRTGTYPGFVDVNFGIGGPAYYHKLSAEAGGATTNRLFSYYVGLAGVNQDYRYTDQFNGVSDPLLFYPVYFPEYVTPSGNYAGHFNFWDGTPGPPGSLNFAPGATYAIAHTMDRENVFNFHFGIPHHNDAGKDDIQALYLTSEIVADYFSSINDQGGPANVVNAVGNNGNAYYHDGYVYDGPLYATPNVSDIAISPFPNAPGHQLGGSVSNNAQDYSDNGVALTKIQYQRNFNSKSYLRLYGYTEYSNWFIGGPANSQFTNYYGAELNDYELPSHTFGFNANYSNQLSNKNLLSVTGSYTAAQVQRRFGYGFPGNTLNGYDFANYVGTNGDCYSPQTGVQVSCFATQATFPGDAPGSPSVPADLNALRQLLATRAPAGSAAALAGAQWLTTGNGYDNVRLNQVSPAFSAVAATDQWRPNDRLTVTLGARLENYDDRLADTTESAARQFWFNAYNNEYCYKPGVSPVNYGPGATNATCASTYGPGYIQANLVNALEPHVSANVFEPRFGATYSLNADSVLRGSFGVYARPVNTSWVQYDSSDANLASFIGSNFLAEGYNTPIHDLHPDTSYNGDFSLEQHLKGTDLSFKLTPFYRATKNQLQPVPIGAGGVVSGFNVGQQTSTGVEFALKKGDFGREGISAQLAYTYTHSRIKYNNFPGGTNVIDNINSYVQQYNSYTSACAKITAANANLCGYAPGQTNPNAAPSFPSSATGTLIANPYYNNAPQPLLDRSGEYTTYDEIPQPFTGENGYETPDVASLIVSWKHKALTLTPSLTYSSGAKYGSPLSYPGYIPNPATPCAAKAGTQGANGLFAADPYTCGSGYLLIPDAFTGKFDNLGAFDEPQRLTLNFAASYQASKSVKFSLAVTGLVDTCFQRGYAWDDRHVCVYSELPSGGAGLGPSGNFIPISQTPAEFRFPYAAFNNNLNTGFLGTTIPLDLTANMEIKL
jgi:hypothetical protein